jgi:hypothetical protein
MTCALKLKNKHSEAEAPSGEAAGSKLNFTAGYEANAAGRTTARIILMASKTSTARRRWQGIGVFLVCGGAAGNLSEIESFAAVVVR